ncbi:hypothetical protein CYPRO_0219 [Cyclonatronum proteinivorum]|uniref:Uncharacterized protein n=1 Tax=Cyclonatronum proteinivorum TaxID=1457365 RepID=A0A345UGA5_9BACT|nr:hypothetical protein CYPRO_0219 [Cyclonatronum proteinivorum]
MVYDYDLLLKAEKYPRIRLHEVFYEEIPPFSLYLKADNVKIKSYLKHIALHLK